MCGIAGLFGGGGREELTRMAEIQSHRGPDDQGVLWLDEHHGGLAHRRLSIIDLSEGGHQPMANRAGTRWISFNGEIYNYRELRADLMGRGHTFRSDSDTEVILAAWDEWGPACVDRLDGMFAFAIYDTLERELHLVRDHLGVKPLYYTTRGGMIAFASEAKALFEVEEIDRIISPDAVASALMLLWVPEPLSGFVDILKLEPGCIARWKDGKLTLRRYWEVPCGADPDDRRSEGELVEELRSLLVDAVRRQTIADVPIGAFLSGGLDSSLVVALMRQVTNGPLHTYTIAFDAQDLKMEAMPDDARYAARVAEMFGTEHREIVASADDNRLLGEILWHLDEPVADGAAINTLLISRAAKAEGTTVLLNGMGGDEVFGGYRRQFATLAIERYRRLPAWMREGIIAPLVERLPVAIGGRGLRPVRWGKRFVRGAALEPIDAFIHGFAYFTPGQMEELLQGDLADTPFEELYPVRRYREQAALVADRPLIDLMTWLDTTMFLPGLNLLYSDKASMAASIESRPPLIDRRLVEFMARVPGEMKIRGRTQKYLLKRAAEAWLPHDIIYRAKGAFGTPIRSWMRNGLEREARERFVAQRDGKEGPIGGELPLRLLDEHAAGREDNAHRLWGLLAVGRWIERNGESDAPSPAPAPATSPVEEATSW